LFAKILDLRFLSLQIETNWAGGLGRKQSEENILPRNLTNWDGLDGHQKDCRKFFFANRNQWALGG
jgi:hypothetical protein